jgi:hypothetical protein
LDGILVSLVWGGVGGGWGVQPVQSRVIALVDP